MEVARTSILVVEADFKVASELVQSLRYAGFAPELATTASQALVALKSVSVDLVLLDLSLPGQDGLELLEHLRVRMSVPVIVLTARASLQDRLKSFELGADDFVAKPFWFEELLARINVHLRTAATRKHRIVKWADCEVDFDARGVKVAGVEIEVTPTEFSLLAVLIARPGFAMSRQRLSRLVANGRSLERTIDTHVVRLRRKLGKGGAAIQTVPAVGYRFEGDDVVGSR